MIITIPKHYPEDIVLHGVQFTGRQAEVPEGIAHVLFEFYGAKELKKGKQEEKPPAQ